MGTKTGRWVFFEMSVAGVSAALWHWIRGGALSRVCNVLILGVTWP